MFVGVFVGVFVAVPVGVDVGVEVPVEVGVTVEVEVGVAVGIADAVAVGVTVTVAVGVGVPVATVPTGVVTPARHSGLQMTVSTFVQSLLKGQVPETPLGITFAMAVRTIGLFGTKTPKKRPRGSSIPE